MFDTPALSGAPNRSGRDNAGGKRLLRIGVARGWKLIQVSGFAGTRKTLDEAVRPVLGAHLPVNVGIVNMVGTKCLLKTGPEQFWIITRDGEHLAPALGNTVAPEVGVVTPLSHSRVCIAIDGPSARDVLATGIGLDFHDDPFGIGHFALTGLHHTPVMIHRGGESRYDIYAMRTFAQWTWEWLTDAALAYGYDTFEPHCA